MLKNEIETLKEENNKLKHDMSEKEILINGLTGKLHEERAKKCDKEKLDKCGNINLDKMYYQKRETDLHPFKTLKMKC